MLTQKVFLHSIKVHKLLNRSTRKTIYPTRQYNERVHHIDIHTNSSQKQTQQLENPCENSKKFLFFFSRHSAIVRDRTQTFRLCVCVYLYSTIKSNQITGVYFESINEKKKVINCRSRWNLFYEVKFFKWCWCIQHSPLLCTFYLFNSNKFWQKGFFCHFIVFLLPFISVASIFVCIKQTIRINTV